MTDVNLATMNDAEKLAYFMNQANKIKESNPNLETAERIIKIGDNKGGLYFTDPSLVATSAKGKEYQAGVNMPLSVAQAFFANDELIGQIKEWLTTDMKTPIQQTVTVNKAV